MEKRKKKQNEDSPLYEHASWCSLWGILKVGKENNTVAQEGQGSSKEMENPDS